MDIGTKLNESLKFITVFTIKLGGYEIPVTETVLWTWIVMAILILLSLILTRKLAEVPRGAQTLLEAGVEFLENFSAEQFGQRARTYGPYIGTIFLFLLVANIIPVISPIGVFGREPPFTIKPPTRDINLTAAMALITIMMVLIGGIRAKGFKGWLKTLISPMPMMLPFNLMEYAIKPLSLCLRLFGNMLGAFIIMRLIESVAPVAIPPICSLYFDFFDGFVQALVFTFLTVIYIAEAVKSEEA